jgi:DNA repair protein RadC
MTVMMKVDGVMTVCHPLFMTTANTTQAVQLQGIGLHNAKPASELAVGDVTVWNYGSTAEVISVTEASPVFLLVNLRDEKSGQVSPRRLKKTRLVAVSTRSSALKAADVSPADSAKSETAEAYKAVSRPPTVPNRSVRIGSAIDAFAQLSDIKAADREHFVVFDLDARNRVIARRIVSIGSLTGVDVHPREVFKAAVINSAAAIVMAHNHPSGDPSPSRADLELTKRLYQAGEILGIIVLDHVIVAEGGFVSLADRGQLS